MCITHGVTKLWVELIVNIVGVLFFAAVAVIFALEVPYFPSTELDPSNLPGWLSPGIFIALALLVLILMLLNVVFFGLLLTKSDCCLSLRDAIFGESLELHGFEIGGRSSAWSQLQAGGETMEYLEGSPPAETLRFIHGRVPREVLTYEEGIGAAYNETLLYIEGTRP